MAYLFLARLVSGVVYKFAKHVMVVGDNGDGSIVDGVDNGSGS